MTTINSIGSYSDVDTSKVSGKFVNNAEIRDNYNAEVSNAYEKYFKPQFAEFHEQEQCFNENLAREAYNARSTIKQANQKETSWLGRAGIALHNLMNYGSFSNPTFDYFISKGKNPEEIAYSAFKTDGSDLGLKNNGFGDTLKIWHAVKTESPGIYPEQITSDMVDCFRQTTGGNFNRADILINKEVCMQESSGKMVNKWLQI